MHDLFNKYSFGVSLKPQIICYYLLACQSIYIEKCSTYIRVVS
jgi:hypothetical protein